MSPPPGKSSSALARARDKLMNPERAERNRLKDNERARKRREKLKEKKQNAPLTRAQEVQEEQKKQRHAWVNLIYRLYVIQLINVYIV